MMPYQREMLVPKAKAGHSSYAFYLLIFKRPLLKKSVISAIDKLIKMHDALSIKLDDALATGKLNFQGDQQVNAFSNLTDLNLVHHLCVHSNFVGIWL